MRTILIALMFVISMGLTTNASDTIASSKTSSASYTEYSPQVCQFSLTSYTGIIEFGKTGKFQVGLSCPQENDVRATVVVFINGEHIASKVVTIKAGNDYSQGTEINVGTTYNGKNYKLVVQ